MRRFWILFSLALLAGLLIPLSYGGWEGLSRLRELPPSVMVGALAMVVLGWNLNAGRLRLVLGGIGSGMGQGKALATVMSSEFAMSATPAGTGGALTYIFLLHRHGIPSSRAAACYALEQLVDQLFFLPALVLLSIVLLAGGDEFHVGTQLALLGGMIASGLGLLWLLAHHYRKLMLAGGRLLNRFGIKARRRRNIARWIIRFRQGLGLMLRFSRWRLLAIYLLCIGHWLLRYTILYFIIRALGEEVSWAYLFLVQMFVLSVGQLTLLPGGSGGVEIGFSALLAAWLEPATLAAALLAWRFATYYWYLIAGGPVFFYFAGSGLWRHLRGRSRFSGKARTMQN